MQSFYYSTKLNRPSLLNAHHNVDGVFFAIAIVIQLSQRVRGIPTDFKTPPETRMHAY